MGLETAVLLAGILKEKHDLTVELMVVGDVNDAVKAHAYTLAPAMDHLGWGCPRSEIPALDRAAHVLLALTSMQLAQTASLRRWLAVCRFWLMTRAL